MKRRQMIFGIGVVAILAALFTWNFSRGRQSTSTSQSQSTTSSQTATASTSLQTDRDLSGDNDVLVVYF